MRYLLVFFILLTSPQKNTTKYCDDLIAKGIDALYNKKHTASLELLTEAQGLSKKNNWHKQYFIATNCIGLNYYDMMDYGEALDSYLEAYTVALKELDSSQEMVVLNNIALIYMQEGKLDEAEKYQKRAYDIAMSAKDSIKIGLYSSNLASIYNETHKLNEATKYINSAKLLVPKNSKLAVKISVSEAQNLVARGRYDEAEKVITPLIPKLQIIELNDYKIAVLLMLSKIYEHDKNLNEALLVVEKAKKENLSYRYNNNIYNRFSELFFIKKDYKKSLQYKDSVMLVKDSLYALKDKTLYESSKIKLEIKDYQKELTESQNKLNTEKQIRYYLFGFTILIISLLVWLLRSNYIKFKQKKIIADNTQKIIELELHNKKNDNLLLEQKIQEKETLSNLEKEISQNELDSKNRKLAANALQQAYRNEKIEEFINSLNKEPELSRNTFLSKRINLLKSFLKKENESSEFLTHFEEVNSNFLTRLKEKHPKLNSNDIRFVCYMYMNLTTKEISSLFNITPEASRKRKERVANKMDLTDSNILYSYISSI